MRLQWGDTLESAGERLLPSLETAYRDAQALMGAPDQKLKTSVLYAGVKRLGTLTYDDMEWPRYYFRFEPTPEFETFRKILDLRGSLRATEENVAAAEKLDLRVVSDDGECIRLRFIFIDGSKAVIREGAIIEEPPRTQARHDEVWRVLEDEVGPEQCGEPGCTRLRMSLSLFCKRHHFRMIMHEDYEGTMA